MHYEIPGIPNGDKGEFVKSFIPFLNELGLLRYASVMASVCHRYMGIDMPDTLPLSEESVCEEIL